MSNFPIRHMETSHVESESNGKFFYGNIGP